MQLPYLPSYAYNKIQGIIDSFSNHPSIKAKVSNKHNIML